MLITRMSLVKMIVLLLHCTDIIHYSNLENDFLESLRRSFLT